MNTANIGLYKLFLIVIIGFVCFTKTDAQTQKDSIASKVLYLEIAQMDSILFDAFNTQNIEKNEKPFYQRP
jgi:hypothetical protein